ncbi:hypothetical protein RHOFW104T7_13200 [Rhodanobacter thiooxydans]|uniref:Uncharacterized protein n=1 Tax=Rhodanobacter thiooxydans TaxID=416169 RepID=A0A154QGZ9_9GAMM|nr:hypothetical protein [Rhodanobacter thiooxydans]KZC23553.1 hypothetical protein RHOFW104T7_13200 [Rhodanobacter thiooxydans]
MKITIQPTHIGQLAAGESAVTVNCHDDDGAEIVLFNAIYDGVKLTAINGTRKLPEDSVAEGAIEAAAEVLAARFEALA